MRRIIGAIGVLVLAVGAARGADWAAVVRGYSAGATYSPPSAYDPSFTPPANAANASFTTGIGGQAEGTLVPALEGITGDTGYGVMTPFNAAYDAGQMVGIGEGGWMTLEFASPVRTDGWTIGVHTAVGLIDFDWPNGSTYPPSDPSVAATAYTTARRAMVEVSADGGAWVTLGTFDFGNPSNFYASGVSTPGYQVSASGAVADVTKPFLGTVGSFDGKDWNGVLGVLNGSAGGTWLDLSGSGLETVGYVRFSAPSGSSFYLDGVVGLPVPEPASLVFLALGLLGLMRRRR